MIHTALARKYRPKRFTDLVAQDHVAAGLAGAVAKTRVAHAYLLTGPRGVGKTSAARILAMALNCERAGERGVAGEPCGTCESCTRIWSGSTNLDVVEIDAASNRGVDDARELRERAMYAASAPGRFKVYIIDEAHMLTREAWNALLKILEEPPPQVVFVFATTEPQKIANTAAPVLSRLQRFDFRRIGQREIVERLRQVAEGEAIEADPDALHLIARVADGGMRDALSVLDQVLAFGGSTVTPQGVRDALGLVSDEAYAELLEIVGERRTAEVFPFVARLVEAGVDLAEFANGLGDVVRGLLLTLLGGAPEGLSGGLREVIGRVAGGYSQGDLLRMLKLLGEAEESIRRSPNPRLHVETLLLQWTLLDRTVEITELIRALGGNPSNEPRHQTAPEPSRRAAPDARPARARGPKASAPPSVRAVRDAWPDVLDQVGRRRRMAREALDHAEPVALHEGAVVLEVADRGVHLEGLERSRELIAEALSEVLGHTVSVVLRPPGGDDQPPEGPRRLDEEANRAERLRQYRAKDEALDAVADALDLELLE